MLESLDRHATHVVSVCTSQSDHGICQVQFTKTALQVHFPYQLFAVTAISRCEMDVGRTAQVDLAPGGGRASFPPKYAHKIDGRCHFSQDGKMLTRIINQSRPLLEHRGHLLTVDIQQPDTFAEPNYRARYGRAEFEVNPLPQTLHFAFFWYRMGAEGIPPLAALHNPIVLRSSDGDRPCLGVVAPPDSVFADHLLLIHARPREPVFLGGTVCLSLVGGFGADLGDPTRPSSALFMRAPAADIAERLQDLDWIGPATARPATTE